MMKKCKIKSLSALLLAFLLCLSMTACGINSNRGDAGEAEETGESAGAKGAEEEMQEVDLAEAEEADPDFANKKLLESGEFGDYKFEIAGAEVVQDSEGNQGIRLWYDFTNNSESETESAYWLSTVTAYQDGEELERTAIADDKYGQYDWNSSLKIRPGIKIRCLEDFSYNEEGGPICFEIINWRGDTNEIVAAVYQLDELPGVVKEETELAAIEKPLWTDGYDLEGDTESAVHIQIDTAEETEDADGNRLIRIYAEITNSGENAIIANDVFGPAAYQDGVELRYGFPKDEIEEDNNGTWEIQKGESLRTAYCYRLRSDSPVEMEGLLDYTSGNVIGGVFRVK